MMEYTAPGVSSGMPPPFLPTPRQYTAGERNINTARGTSHSRFADGEGSFIIAVVMISNFGEVNLPGAQGLDPALDSDLSTWNEIYSATSDLASECVTHLGAVGWTVVGKESDVRLKASTAKGY